MMRVTGKRPLDVAHEDGLRESKRRITQGIGALHLGSPPAPGPAGIMTMSPFGTRTRIIPREVKPLGFDDTFKRALDITASAPAPVHVSDSLPPNPRRNIRRMRDRDMNNFAPMEADDALVPAPRKKPKKAYKESNALVVYRPRTTAADLLRPPEHAAAGDAWLARRMKELSDNTIVEEVNDEMEEEEGEVDADTEIVIDDSGTTNHPERAMVPLASAAARRRARQLANAARQAGPLVRTQTAILMPWRDEDEEMTGL